LTASGFTSRARAAASMLPLVLSKNISERFWLLAQYPYIGRARDQDLGPGLRSLIADDYVIIHRVEENDIVLVLHVVAGNRDIVALFGAEG
jgi:plasmid stabilization system protein ParE